MHSSITLNSYINNALFVSYRTDDAKLYKRDSKNVKNVRSLTGRGLITNLSAVNKLYHFKVYLFICLFRWMPNIQIALEISMFIKHFYVY